MTVAYGATGELDKMWTRDTKGEGRARPQCSTEVTALRPRFYIICVIWGSQHNLSGLGRVVPTCPMTQL